MRAICSIGIILSALALAGCNHDDVKVYRVEKETSAAPLPLIETEVAVQNQNPPPQLKYVLPEGWQEDAPAQMRVASFLVTNASGQVADVGVIPLAVNGQEVQLVNMWRQQMQLPVLTNENAAGEAVAIGDASGKFFEIASEALLVEGKFRARILVAELPRGGLSWFFKMTGEDSFVASQKNNFIQFLKSVSFVENVPAPIASLPEAQNESSQGIWKIPQGWQPAEPGMMLFAKFSISSGDARADVNISQMTGEGGGLLANVNRWRGQLGLPPLTEENFLPAISEMEIPGGKARMVDFTGTDAKTGKPARLIGVVVPQNGQTWFYKLMGDETVVAAQKDAFIQFIQSANYAHARSAS